MDKENIMRPEINLLKNDEFYLLYEMMMQALKTDDVKEDINKSLYMLRTFLNSGSIALYIKSYYDNYIYKISDSSFNDLLKQVSSIISEANPLIEKKGILKLDTNLEKLKNVVFLHAKSDETDCIVAITNIDKDKKLEPLFWERAKDTIQIIIKRAVSYEKNTRAINTDLLTGLDNRNSYETRIKELNKEDNDLILGIFDLFRLKYVNDNFSHSKGDDYIKKAAKILNRYWPKQKVIINDDGTETFIDTGHFIYRIGGDEFVLLTNQEDLKRTELKASLAAEEAKLINLGIAKDLPLGLNYGITSRNNGEYIKQTFIRADEIMQEDKLQTYKKYNVKRRH
ncbi:MAG: diguanylate cyclase [Bacilli bacterium]|nr:diguanylate cyclase [Bacilli bacterium]